jgi:basic amino acid/polyamine antiporter, APA family
MLNLDQLFPEAGGEYLGVREGLARPNAFFSGRMAWFAHIVAAGIFLILCWFWFNIPKAI